MSHKKIIQTVCGAIDPEVLGTTLMHEHLLWDITVCWNGCAQEMSLRRLAYEPITMNHRGQIAWNPYSNLDNLFQNDIETAIDEVNLYKRAGGCSIVDATVTGIGRDPCALYAISKQTGINIIMGSGYYVERVHPKELKDVSKEEIAQSIIDEFRSGVGINCIKPGIIGEIGVSDINNEQELKSLRGAALAQKELGAALSIHIPLFEERLHKILDTVENEGADLNKVILSHCDSTLPNMNLHYSLAERGVTIEYDLFGLELLTRRGKFLPQDIQRIASIKSMIEHGYADRITVSHDVSFKIKLTRYGGFGYGHILNNIIPLMLAEGISREDISRIVVENPKCLLMF